MSPFACFVGFLVEMKRVVVLVAKHLADGARAAPPPSVEGEESFQSFRSPAAEDVARLAATAATPTPMRALAHQASDTTRAWRRVPLVQHNGWNAFAAALPFGAVLVAVEMGGEPLHAFEHPERAVYVLGSEDNGLPDAVPSITIATRQTPSQYEERLLFFNLTARPGSVITGAACVPPPRRAAERARIRVVQRRSRGLDPHVRPARQAAAAERRRGGARRRGSEEGCAAARHEIHQPNHQ